MDLKAIVRKRVIQAAEELDLSPTLLGAETGHNRGYVSQILNDRQGPSINILVALVDSFAIDGNWLLTGVGPMKRPTTLVRAPGPPTQSDTVSFLVESSLSDGAEDVPDENSTRLNSSDDPQAEPWPHDERPLTGDEADRLAEAHPDAAYASIIPAIDLLQTELSRLRSYGVNPKLQDRVARILEEHPEAEEMIGLMLDNVESLLAKKAKNGR